MIKYRTGKDFPEEMKTALEIVVKLCSTGEYDFSSVCIELRKTLLLRAIERFGPTEKKKIMGATGMPWTTIDALIHGRSPRLSYSVRRKRNT